MNGWDVFGWVLALTYVALILLGVLALVRYQRRYRPGSPYQRDLARERARREAAYREYRRG